jgi:NADH dehydrogenase
MSWLRTLSVLPTHFSDTKKPTIVVAGYGWGTHAFVERIDLKKYDVTVVSKDPHRLNQNQMIGSLSPSYTKPLCPVILDTCMSIDKDKRLLKGLTGAYPYDYLVIATGSEANTFGIPGVAKYCQMCKTGDDIKTIRSKVDEGIQEATVLGAGPTGVELACSLIHHGVPNVRIVEGADTILPGFSENMRKFVYSRLGENRIHLFLNRPIQSITDTTIITKMGGIPYSSNSSLIWTCGIRPVEFVRSLGNGRPLQVDKHLRYSDTIFALGDSIAGHGPPTAQNARQQGEYLAAHLNTLSETSYTYKELGRCLDLGDGLLIEAYDTLVFVPHLFWKEYSMVISN